MPHPSALDADTRRRIDEILSRPTLARLATASPRTLQPHVVPVWFYWDGESLWVSGFRSTRKFKELRLNPRCAVVVDGGGPPPTSVATATLVFPAIHIVSTLLARMAALNPTSASTWKISATTWSSRTGSRVTWMLPRQPKNWNNVVNLQA